MKDTELRGHVLHTLQNVKDPELPSISIVELGMFDSAKVENGKVSIVLLPTFSGCPALDIIEKEVKEAVSTIEGVMEVQVHFSFDPPWTTDRLSAAGRENLKAYGISPPPPHHRDGDPWKVHCPYCGSTYVTMENIFGPTACRSILYCRNCHNPFEAMKPVANLNFDQTEEAQNG